MNRFIRRVSQRTDRITLRCRLFRALKAMDGLRFKDGKLNELNARVQTTMAGTISTDEVGRKKMKKACMLRMQVICVGLTKC